MSYTPEELLKLASAYNNVATRALVVKAEEKKNLSEPSRIKQHELGHKYREYLDTSKTPLNPWETEELLLEPAPPEELGEEVEGLLKLESDFFEGLFAQAKGKSKKSPETFFKELAEDAKKAARDSHSAKDKKLDPKAKVRNRGSVCVPAEQAKDKKDHFPINDEGQARNALARVQQLTSAPWYKGSLEGLKALVARKVKAKYPGINVGGKDSKKKASEYYDALLNKFAQQVSYSVGLSNTDKQRLMGLVSALAGNNGPLSKELSDAFGKLATQRTEENGNSYFVPEYVQEFLPTLDKVKVALNQTAPNGPEYNTAAELYDIFKSMTVASGSKAAPTQGHGGLGRRDDVEKAQQRLNSMIMSGKLTSKALDPDGKLGNLTRAVLKEYKESIGLPSFTDEQIIAALNKGPEAPEATPANSNPNQTWGGNSSGIVRDNPF